MNIIDKVRHYRRTRVLPKTIQGPQEAEELDEKLRLKVFSFTLARKDGDPVRMVHALAWVVFEALNIVARTTVPWEAAWSAVLKEALEGQDTVRSWGDIQDAMEMSDQTRDPMSGISRKVVAMTGTAPLGVFTAVGETLATREGSLIFMPSPLTQAEEFMTATQEADLLDAELRKVSMADEVYFLDGQEDQPDYVKEILAYAQARGIPVRRYSDELE